MKLLFVALALGLTGCSGWINEATYHVSGLPPAFDSDEVLHHAGYRLRKTSRTDGAQPVVEQTFTRARYPELTTRIFSDHSAFYSFWESGVPPFEWPSPNFQRGITDLLNELEQAGIRKDQIQRISGPPIPTTPEAISPAIPTEFTAYIGGMLGGGYRIVLKGNVITYTVMRGGLEERTSKKITPTPAQWRDFRQALDHLGVWKWRASYMAMVDDGTQWSLSITYADQRLKAVGDNAYPDTGGKRAATPEYTATFTAYLHAVERLLGGRHFQ